MKIALDCRFWGPEYTGLGRYTQNLVNNLLKIDKKNNYFLIFNKRDFEKIKIDRLLVGHKITIVLVDIPFYSLKEQLVLPLILKKIDPDLVHFLHFNVPIFYRGSYVVTIHDLIKHWWWGKKSTTHCLFFYLLKYLGYRLVFKTTILRAKKIIVPSQIIKNQIKEKFFIREEKIKVVYEGVEEIFLTEKRKKNQQKNIFTQNKIKKPFLLYVGNAYPHKNLENLIFAIKLINKKKGGENEKITLVIICPRDIFYQRLKGDIVAMKAKAFVRLVNFVSDENLKEFYQAAEAYICSSLMEGFGLPGLEAMASGSLVICSNIPVFKEIYGKAAFYFNPMDPYDMKEKILKAINLKPQEKKFFIERGKKWAKKYLWERCAYQTIKTYYSLKGEK